MKHCLNVLLFLLLLVEPAFGFSNHQPVSISGYGTLGAVRSDSDVSYLGFVDRDTDFNSLTRFGVNFVKSLSDEITTQVQLVARGSEGAFKAFVNVAQVQWATKYNVTFRGGLLRLPAYLISDYIDVGEAYIWNSPPAEFYGFSALDNFLGLSALYSKSFGSLALDVEVYVGGGDGEFSFSGIEREIESKDLIGANVKFGTSKWKLRYGLLRAGRVDSKTIVNDDTTVFSGNTFSRRTLVTISTLNNLIFSSFGLQVDTKRFIALAEHAAVFTESSVFKHYEAYYATLGYKLLQSRLIPYVTFAELVEAEGTTFTGTAQNTISLGAKYQLSEGVSLKGEVSRIKTAVNGTDAGLFASAPNRDVYMAGASINFVF